MTVSSSLARQTYIGDGSLATYPYNFRIFDAGDLVLVKRDTATGIETLLALTTDYTVTGAGGYNGGTFTLLAGVLPTGYDLAAFRELDILQTTDLRNQGAYLAEVQERALDRLVMISQQLQDQVNRSVRLPDSEAGGDLLKLPAKEVRAGKQLTFDPVTADPTVSSPAAAAVSAAMQAVVASATLDLAATAFAFSATGATAARNMRDRAADVINALEYTPDRAGATDATTALQNAINAATAGQTVYIPRGTYLTTGLTINKQVRLVGDGAGTILRASGNTAQVITHTAGNGSVISDLRIEGTKTDETGGAQFGIRVTGGSRGVIERVWFNGSVAATNGLNIQIHLAVVDYWRIRSCLFEQCYGTNSGFGYGMLVETSNGTRITECVSIQSASQGRHHVYLSAGTSRCYVGSNLLESGTGEQISIYAIESQGWCENNTIEGNTCLSCASAVALSGAIGLAHKVRYNQIVSNTIRASLQHGVIIQGSQSAAESRAPFNHVAGNIIAECGTMGVYFAGCDDCTARANDLSDNSQTSAGTSPNLQISPGSANTPTVRNMVIGNTFRGTATPRAPWRVGQGNGVRPADNVITGNHSPKGNFKWAQDDGDKTVFDETYVIRRTLSYTDFSIASTTNAVNLFALGPGEKVESVVIKHETAFTGGAIATYTISVGITANFLKYAGAFNVFQAPGGTVFQNADTNGIENMTTTETNIRALATSGGANLNAATAGQVNIWVRVRRYAMPVQ